MRYSVVVVCELQAPFTPSKDDGSVRAGALTRLPWGAPPTEPPSVLVATMEWTVAGRIRRFTFRAAGAEDGGGATEEAEDSAGKASSYEGSVAAEVDSRDW